MSQQETLRILFTLKETAHYLRCSLPTLWKIRKDKLITPVFVGQKEFYCKDELDRYLGVNNVIYLTPVELYNQIGIKRQRLVEWDDAGLKHYLIDGQIKYKVSDVYSFLKKEAKL